MWCLSSRVLTIIFMTLTVGACHRAPLAGDKVHHVVLCWLKDAGNQAQREQLIAVSRGFADIPGIVNLRAGTVVASDRPIVDDSYDVGIYMSFANVEDMQRYLSCEAHVQAVRETLQPLVKKIVVYDFIE